MKRIKIAILTLGLVASFGIAAMPNSVGAWDPFAEACTGVNANTALCNGSEDKAAFYLKIIINTLLFVLAAVSVIVIIIAGIYYTTSGGDAALIAKAKNTLLYAVIGLIVAIMAYPIVNFVIGRFA